jgi:DNA-binding beta-propeller fold protein YncE
MRSNIIFNNPISVCHVIQIFYSIFIFAKIKINALKNTEVSNNEKTVADPIISTILVGRGPYGAVYDPGNNRIYVTVFPVIHLDNLLFVLYFLLFQFLLTMAIKNSRRVDSVKIGNIILLYTISVALMSPNNSRNELIANSANAKAA